MVVENVYFSIPSGMVSFFSLVEIVSLVVQGNLLVLELLIWWLFPPQSFISLLDNFPSRVTSTEDFYPCLDSPAETLPDCSLALELLRKMC